MTIQKKRLPLWQPLNITPHFLSWCDTQNENWPHLLKQSANGVWEIDRAMAEIAKNSVLVNEETKLMLQQYIDLQDKLEKSCTKIKEIVTEFAGNLAPNIQNSLVEAFKAGENAIVKMGETMDKVVENMVASLIFQSVFKDTFKKLETEMEKSIFHLHLYNQPYPHS